MSTPTNDRQQAIETLRGLINAMRVGMLTTHGAEGRLHSRPMLPARHSFDGDLWFFALEGSPLVSEMQANSAVNVAYVAPQQFISVGGTGEVVRDRKKMELLWKDELKSWFPDGLATANLVLLRIAADEAEFWDEKATGMGKLLGTVLWKRAGQQVHEKIQWPEPAVKSPPESPMGEVGPETDPLI